MNAPLEIVYRFGARTAQDEVELWAPAQVAAVASLRGRLGSALIRLGWSQDAVSRVAIAVTEALANAVEHGSTSDGRVGFSYRVTAESAWVRVTDEGRPGAAVPVGAPAGPPLESEGGRGRLLMQALSESYLTRPAGRGTEVVLEFLRLGSLAD
jgi:anti-sigma regulatory factor (Ser/Thr protein kinase)